MLALLKTRRFAPLFFTQLCGALNDNLLRNAMIVMVTFGLADAGGLSAQTVINLSAGLFILPFFLLSATAGQLADKLDKARLIRALKRIELGLMLLAAAGLWTNSLPLLLLTLLLTGAQSAFFGPVKYSILPQQLRPRELVAGNSWVELGTFVAILLGTILGGTLMARGPAAVATALLACAALGMWSSRRIPAAPAPAPDLRVRFRPWSQTLAVVQRARRDRPVFLSILGNSWFWLFGAMLLALLPAVGTERLGGRPSVVTAILVAFSVGVALGSLLCERLSRGSIQLGLVPVGAALTSAFGLHLAYALASHTPAAVAVGPAAVPVAVYLDLVGMGVGGGLFIVPLYALMQERSAPQERSQIIAANNIINAVFVVGASAAGIGLHALGLSTVGVLLVAVLVNAAVGLYACARLPVPTLHIIARGLVRLMYRFGAPDIDRIPAQGPAVLVCNHISFIDALVVGAASPRPPRFVMDHRIFATPVLRWLFRTVGTIPIAPRHEDPRVLQQAFDQIAQALTQGELLCIFPEGKITHTGQLNPFRQGVERILERNPVPVIPMALRGLWGSFFSRKDGPAMRKLPRRFRARVELRCGTPVAPHTTSAQALQHQVRRLLRPA